MGGKRIGAAAQRGQAQGGVGLPVAVGDEDEFGLGCGAYADGQLGLRLRPAEDNRKTSSCTSPTKDYVNGTWTRSN